MPEEFEMPDVFVQADSASVRAQGHFLTSTRVQLFLLILAASAGAFSLAVGRFEVAALVAGVAFLIAAGLRLVLLRRRPHRLWYEGRAAAESLKTLSWRFAVGGDPLGVGEEEGCIAAFESKTREVVDSLRSVVLTDASAVTYEPTSSMQTLRSASLDMRRDAYVRGRIEDQLNWYTAKSEWNRLRSRAWGGAIVIFQLVGATGAFLRGFGVVTVDLFGIAAAVAASGAAWLETKQHGSLASAYRVAADELRRIRDMASTPKNEKSWAHFVSDAEEAISREHTMWKATATSPARLA